MSGIFARDIFSDEALGQADYRDEFKIPTPVAAPVSALPQSIRAIAPALVLQRPSTAPAPTDPSALPPPSFQPQAFDVPPGTGPDAPAPAPSNFNLFSNPIFFWGAIGGGVLLVGATGYFLLKKKKTTPNRRRRR